MSLERQDEKFCRPCWRNKGLKVLAHRITATGPKCDSCWRGNVEVLEQAAPVSILPIELPPIELKPREKEKPMPGKFSGIDKVAMQRDRESGMAVLSIAKKYACPSWFVYQNTKAGTNSAKRVAKAARAKAPAKSSSAANGDGTVDYGAVLASIEGKIAKLQAAATAIRELAGL